MKAFLGTARPLAEQNKNKRSNQWHISPTLGRRRAPGAQTPLPHGQGVAEITGQSHEAASLHRDNDDNVYMLKMRFELLDDFELLVADNGEAGVAVAICRTAEIDRDGARPSRGRWLGGIATAQGRSRQRARF